MRLYAQRRIGWGFSDFASMVLLCTVAMVLVVMSLDQWAKADPNPYCNADTCAESADTLRMMEGGQS